jgi:hypothetical protein
VHTKDEAVAVLPQLEVRLYCTLRYLFREYKAVKPGQPAFRVAAKPTGEKFEKQCYISLEIRESELETEGEPKTVSDSLTALRASIQISSSSFELTSYSSVHYSQQIFPYFDSGNFFGILQAASYNINPSDLDSSRENFESSLNLNVRGNSIFN